MRGLRLGALLLVLATLPLATSMPAPSLPAQTDPGLLVNGARLAGPALVEAGVPATFTGSFRTGAAGITTSATSHAGETVWLELDGARVASATVRADNGFAFTLPLARGSHELRAVTDPSTSAPGFSFDPHFVTAAVRPGAPLAFAAGPGIYWDDVRLTWQPPADDGGTPVTSYPIALSTPERARGFNDLSSADYRLHPDVDYTFTIVACNALGCGPAAPPADYRLPPAVGVDDIRIDVWEVIVCTPDRSFCEGVPPGGTIRVPTSEFFAVAQVQGIVTRDGEGAGIRFDVEGTMALATSGVPPHEAHSTHPGTWDQTPHVRDQFLFFRAGEYQTWADLGTGMLSPGECRDLDILVTATHVGESWTGESDARVCRTG